MRVAALDVDGTLIPDTLAGPLPAMLVSGGTEELLGHLAEELGIDRFAGARFEAADGLYTGGLASTLVAAKDKVVIKLATGADIAWSRSLAIGNSLGDVGLFDRVGQRVSFEPSLRCARSPATAAG